MNVERMQSLCLQKEITRAAQASANAALSVRNFFNSAFRQFQDTEGQSDRNYPHLTISAFRLAIALSKFLAAKADRISS